MALVANPMPIDTMTVGKTVVYYDPTADKAGEKFGTITAVAYGVSGTNEPITLTVEPEGGGTDVVGAARFFRVVDHRMPLAPANV